MGASCPWYRCGAQCSGLGAAKDAAANSNLQRQVTLSDTWENKSTLTRALGTEPLAARRHSSGNVAELICEAADRTPDRIALVIPRSQTHGNVTGEEVHSYRSLVARAGQFAHGLTAAGLREGDRIVILFPPNGDLFPLIIGAAAAGITCVLIELGMGIRRARCALAIANAKAIVSTDKLLRLGKLIPELRRIPHTFTADGRSRGTVRRLSDLAGGTAPLRPIARSFDDEALLNFTSGSTGTPKGVNKTHGVLRGQHAVLSEALPYQPDDVTMPMFATFALHDLASGVTCALPPMDFSHPAATRGDLVVPFANKHGVTITIGSPVYIEGIVNHTLAQSDPIRSLRFLATGGAPVPAELCRRAMRAYPDITCRVIYGAAEAEPLAEIPFEAVRDDTQGHVVGVPCPGVDIAIVNVPEELPDHTNAQIDSWRCEPGAEGEILVHGPHVVEHYVGNPEAERETKLLTPEGALWHRTGDVGRIDTAGNIVLTGRTRDLVPHGERTLHPLIVEARINACLGVRRSALIAHRAAPAGEMLIELDRQPVTAPQAVLDSVRHELSVMSLDDLAVTCVKEIPMDARHNSKIDRPRLRLLREADAAASRLHLPPTVLRWLPTSALNRLIKGVLK